MYVWKSLGAQKKINNFLILLRAVSLSLPLCVFFSRFSVNVCLFFRFQFHLALVNCDAAMAMKPDFTFP